MKEILFGLMNLLEALDRGEDGAAEMARLRAGVRWAGGPTVDRLSHVLGILASEMTQRSTDPTPEPAGDPRD